MDTFHWADYLVFALMLVICAGIGIAFGWFDRKKKSTNNFLLGGGDLSVFPVGVSIIASFTSAVAILGFSAEMWVLLTLARPILLADWKFALNDLKNLGLHFKLNFFRLKCYFTDCPVEKSSLFVMKCKDIYKILSF